MASSDNSMKIHEQCLVAPTSATTTPTPLSLPLTLFDIMWLRFHPVERVYLYSLPLPHSNPSFFFDKVIPKLKTSLSHTLQHFLPLAGKILWPSHSTKPFIQFNPDGDDGVSFIIAQSDDDELFNHILDNSPLQTKQSCALVPHLESSHSFASVISLQITLFPNKGFCIGLSSHHAVLDGKSSTMFMKAWAYVCKSGQEECSPDLEPLFDRELIKDPTGLETVFINSWTQILPQMNPSDDNDRSLKTMFLPIEENSVRATFELTREDLEKIKKRVLSKWDLVEEAEEPNLASSSKPTTLSSFVTSLAYVSVCIAKAFHEAQNVENFSLGLTVDCRARLETPIPENYFGNCVVPHIVDTKQGDFIKDEGLVIVAKRILSKIKMLDKGVCEGVETVFTMYFAMFREGVKIIGVAGSNRFGVYETDFGWGRPAKVEIISIDRGLTIGLADSKDGKGGLEIGLVLNKHVMDLFHANFHLGLRLD